MKLTSTMVLAAFCGLVHAQNVGIGTSTPQARLHLLSSSTSAVLAETNGASQYAGFEAKTSAGPNDNLLLRKWMPGASGSMAGISLDNLSQVVAGAQAAGLMIGVANANPLYFTTNNIERMRITTDGNVGIGTTDPIGILYVQANPVTETSVRFNSAYVGIRHFYMFNNSTASALVIARFGDGIGGTLFGQSNIQLSAIYTNDLGTNALAVGTKNDIPLILGTNNLERLRITGMGNIGIGTTNPTHAFEVNRNDKGSMFLENPIVEANTTVKIGRGVTAARFGRTTPLHVIAASDRAIVAEGDRFEAIEAFTSSPTQAAGYFSAQGTAKLSVELEGFIKVTGDNKTAFKHTTNAGNINNNWTNLSYANATENDIVIVTHNYSPNNTLFNKALGVFWNTSRWSIYTEDQSAMPANISFNVLVIKQ